MVIGYFIEVKQKYRLVKEKLKFLVGNRELQEMDATTVYRIKLKLQSAIHLIINEQDKLDFTKLNFTDTENKPQTEDFSRLDRLDFDAVFQVFCETFENGIENNIKFNTSDKIADEDKRTLRDLLFLLSYIGNCFF